MSNKWQPINLKLEAPLAQALREMKQGHDEPLSEVILRLLWKAVRQQNPLGGRGPSAGRSRTRGDGERGAFGAGGRGKAPGPRGRAAGATGGKGRKPFVPKEAPAADDWSGERAAAAPPRPRPPRALADKPGKPARPRPLRASGEAPKRPFRPGNKAPRVFRPSNERDTLEGRPRRPRKPNGARPAKG
jgi:hypothetical protein